jgi:hypothetical protein
MKDLVKDLGSKLEEARRNAPGAIGQAAGFNVMG